MFFGVSGLINWHSHATRSLILEMNIETQKGTNSFSSIVEMIQY